MSSMKVGEPGGMRVGSRDSRLENPLDGTLPDSRLRGLPDQQAIFPPEQRGQRPPTNKTPTNSVQGTQVRSPWSTTERGNK